MYQSCLCLLQLSFPSSGSLFATSLMFVGITDEFWKRNPKSCVDPNPKGPSPSLVCEAT